MFVAESASADAIVSILASLADGYFSNKTFLFLVLKFLKFGVVCVLEAGMNTKIRFRWLAFGMFGFLLAALAGFYYPEYFLKYWYYESPTRSVVWTFWSINMVIALGKAVFLIVVVLVIRNLWQRKKSASTRP